MFYSRTGSLVELDEQKHEKHEPAQNIADSV